METKLSFTRQIKEEICNNFDFSRERKIAIVSAFIKINGTFRIRNNEYNIILKTDNAKTAKYIFKLISDLFNVNPHFAYENNKKFKDKTIFVLIVDKKVDEILNELFIEVYEEGINDIFKENTEYQTGFIIGSFLATGSCNDPKSSNYHLEIALSNDQIALDLQYILNEFEAISFNFRLIKRRTNFILYIKKSDLISSFLVLIGAIDACLVYENLRIERDFANIDNRLLNLDSANVEKTLKTSSTQLADIKIIENYIGIDNLDNPKVKILCNLRLKYEEASMNDLAKLMSDEIEKTVSKSNISQLFKKIHKIANECRGIHE